MAQIQKLLEVLTSTRSDALSIGEGEPVTLLRGDTAHPITKQRLTAAHWRALVAECVAPVLLSSLDGGQAVNASLRVAEVDFVVRLWRDGALGRSEIRPASAGREAAPAGATSGAPAATHAAGGGASMMVPVVHVVTTPVVEVEPSEPWRAPGDPEAQSVIDELLREQMSRSASDLHLRSGDLPLMRVHGDIVRLDDRQPLSTESLGAMLHAIMPERNRREFYETSDTDFAYEIDGLGRFRVNAFLDRHGPAAVLRAIPSSIITVDELGISPEVQALCKLTKGLVLVTGPTGSGKSTTLSALVDLVNRTRRDHIVTIEDPIEFVHQSKGCLITQRQVGVHTSSFKQALRAALREDPDVVLVGELRDLETVGIAIETAETGHLVFATMHTSTAASTVDRIIDQFPPDRQEQIRVMLSESLKGVIAQTLCRKAGGGRVAAMEILLTTPAVSNLIRESKTFQIPSVMQTSRRLGMITLNDALVDLVARQQVEPKEAYLRAIDKVSLAAALKSRGVDMSQIEPEAPAPPSQGGTTSSRLDTGGLAAKAPAARPGFSLRR
ncbi:MAG: type IV pilus twitching motility protein PilT [Gemmatimonadaceae bacterium]